MAGKPIIFSASSGPGKSTIINFLLEQNLRLRFSIPAKSHAPRGTEKDSVKYYLLSPEKFRARIAAGKFLENAVIINDELGKAKAETLAVIRTFLSK